MRLIPKLILAYIAYMCCRYISWWGMITKAKLLRLEHSSSRLYKNSLTNFFFRAEILMKHNYFFYIIDCQMMKIQLNSQFIKLIVPIFEVCVKFTSSTFLQLKKCLNVTFFIKRFTIFFSKVLFHKSVTVNTY